MVTTRETLPALDSPYALSPSQCDPYRRDGHLLLRQVCTAAEIAAYRPVLAAAVERYKGRLPPLAERDTYGKAFMQIMNLWEQDPECRRFVFARRFARIAAELMRARAVRLYHDQALFKEPRGGLTPWHQDQHYWPLDTDTTVTMWMPLVDVDETMGAMVFASGSHRAGYLGDLPISDQSEAKLKAFVADRGYRLAQPPPLHAGDATFHSGWTLHSAPGNRTDRMREVMTVIYFPDGIRTIAPDNQNRWADLKRWLPGVSPGGLAASPLNPVLYSEEG